MCNGCSFLRVTFNMESLMSGDEKFDCFCLKYQIKGPTNIDKSVIKKGISISDDCPMNVDAESEAESFVAGCTDEFYD